MSRIEEELRKALEITEDALRKANREIESLAREVDQRRQEVWLYGDIPRAICCLLELPHSESGPCDSVQCYTQAIESLQADLAKTEAERVEHSRARYKAEATLEGGAKQ